MESIPPPGDPFYDDIGELVPDEPDFPPLHGPAEPAASDSFPPPEDAGPVTPDEPPAHAKRDWRKTAQPGKPKARPPRITVAVRTDIEAKLNFALEIPGRIWQARDPVCGTVFIEQRPEIASALTEMVCQSPDLVAWFAGGGGQFMLALNLMGALWPVVTVAMAHHVYHSIEAAPVAEEQDYGRFAA